MKPSGLAIQQVVMTGRGILPGTISVMVGMIPGITATAGMDPGIMAGILAVASDVLM